MDSKNNYIGTTSKEFRSRELEAFSKSSRFDNPPMARMFDPNWANTELIPLLRHAYGRRPEIGRDYDFWPDLDMAELVEPWHMPDYPVDDPVFIERLRLALADPQSIQHPSRVANIADDMQLTIRLFIRRYALFGGAFPLASLGRKTKAGLAKEVGRAGAVDLAVSELFTQCDADL